MSLDTVANSSSFVGNSANLLPNLLFSGLIHVGDELREVNGIPVEDKRPEEIIQILVS